MIGTPMTACDDLVVATNRIHVGSTAELLIPGVRAFIPPAPDALDPTTLPVSIAIRPHGAAPAGSDFHLAYWVDGFTDRVGFLLDVDAYPLTVGYYDVWLRIVGVSQIPKWPVGGILVAA